MLISKSKVSEGDIVSLKLVNGDELVGKLTQSSEQSYTISKPCTVMPGAQGLGLIQSLFTADPDVDVEIMKQHVIMIAPTIDKMQKHYIQTTTGIKPVSAGSIIK